MVEFLGDFAPTMLRLLDVRKNQKEMTGTSLIKVNFV